MTNFCFSVEFCVRCAVFRTLIRTKYAGKTSSRRAQLVHSTLYAAFVVQYNMRFWLVSCAMGALNWSAKIHADLTLYCHRAADHRRLPCGTPPFEERIAMGTFKMRALRCEPCVLCSRIFSVASADDEYLCEMVLALIRDISLLVGGHWIVWLLLWIIPEVLARISHKCARSPRAKSPRDICMLSLDTSDAILDHQTKECRNGLNCKFKYWIMRPNLSFWWVFVLSYSSAHKYSAIFRTQCQTKWSYVVWGRALY